tara:strand:+ start:14232 stop:14504 length:273 start_codon:yes stop_codon:yes gene_type:complete
MNPRYNPLIGRKIRNPSYTTPRKAIEAAVITLTVASIIGIGAYLSVGSTEQKRHQDTIDRERYKEMTNDDWKQAERRILHSISEPYEAKD